MPKPIGQTAAGDNTSENQTTATTTTTEDTQTDAPKERLYTESELKEKMSSVAQTRINELNAKHAQELKDARAQWEKEQKMTEEERLNEERKKKDLELAEKERELSLRENRVEAHSLMQEKELPPELVDYVVSPNMDETKANIDKFKKAWDRAIEAGVNKKLAGKTPTDTSPNKTTTSGKANTHDLLFGKKG